MAGRAKLALRPQESRTSWPWHEARVGSIPSAALSHGDRRMEAETYLSSGYGIRLAIEAKSGWKRFGLSNRVWMPSRLKGIQVGPEFGTPFLAATQVFDIRPVPRKWLALEQTADAEHRFVLPGAILVTCSGTVGRTTLAYSAHEKTLITHDLLRVEPIDPRMRGWIYAYLLSSQARAMLAGSHYGHIIKHLEEDHLRILPVPPVSASDAKQFNHDFAEIHRLRDLAFSLADAADQRFAAAIGSIPERQKESGFVVDVSALASKRRRLDSTFYHPVAAALLQKFVNNEKVSTLCHRVWWMPRFKRFYGDAGIPYLSADELFTIDGAVSKRILVDPDDDHDQYFVKPGWIIMACSGQVYGLIGAAMLATPAHAGCFFSHDFIRMEVDVSKVRPGYLLVALTHRTLGRPLVIRLAYGTSIPHLDPGDVADIPIVRLGDHEEGAIADLAEQAAEARSKAEIIEHNMGVEATRLIDAFIET